MEKLSISCPNLMILFVIIIEDYLIGKDIDML